MVTAEQARRDGEHLTLLSIAYYVFAALTLLFALFPLLYLGFGVWMLARPGSFGMPEDGGNAWVGGFMTAFGALWMVASLLAAAALFVTARSLSRRRRHVFCLVVAGLGAVLCIPIGTLLGVLTLVVLMRPSVQDAFAGRAPVDVTPVGG